MLCCQLLIPLFGLLSRHAKRHPLVFTFWAVWLLGAHLLDLFWLVMPNVFIRQMPEAVGAPPGTPLPEVLKQLLASDQSVYQVSAQHQAFMQLVRAPLGPAAVGMVLALVVGLGGMFVATTLWFLRPRAAGARAGPAAGRIAQLREYVRTMYERPIAAGTETRRRSSRTRSTSACWAWWARFWPWSWS